MYLDKETSERIKKNVDAIIAKDMTSKQLIFSKDAHKVNQVACPAVDRTVLCAFSRTPEASTQRL